MDDLSTRQLTVSKLNRQASRLVLETTVCIRVRIASLAIDRILVSTYIWVLSSS